MPSGSSCRTHWRSGGSRPSSGRPSRGRSRRSRGSSRARAIAGTRSRWVRSCSSPGCRDRRSSQVFSSPSPRLPRSSSCCRACPVSPTPTPSLAGSGPCSSSRSRGLVTAPIVWLHFGRVALWTVPANIAAEPAMPPLISLSLAAAAIEPVLPGAATALAWLAGWCAWWLAFVARIVSSWPSAQVSSPVAVVIAAALVGAVVLVRRLPRYRRREGVAALVSLALTVSTVACALRPSPSWTAPSGLRVTFLDVGQGDSALVEAPGAAVLVDEGPPEADVAGQLQRLGVRSLNAIVLTHPQRDHIGGAARVVDRLDVGAVAEPGIEAPSPTEKRCSPRRVASASPSSSSTRARCSSSESSSYGSSGRTIRGSRARIRTSTRSWRWPVTERPTFSSRRTPE